MALRKCTARPRFEIPLKTYGVFFVSKLDDDVSLSRSVLSCVWASSRIMATQSRCHVTRQSDVVPRNRVVIFQNVDESFGDLKGHGVQDDGPLAAPDLGLDNEDHSSHSARFLKRAALKAEALSAMAARTCTVRGFTVRGVEKGPPSPLRGYGATASASSDVSSLACRAVARSHFKRAEAGGPDRDRTGDLLNAIQARSQLRYRPTLVKKSS